MTDSHLYYNPRCSKSRAALELLLARGVSPQVLAYLDEPPSREELHALVAMLDVPARHLLRTGEPEYAELGLDDPAKTDVQLIAAMAAHPQLIERPIFIHAGRAVVGRPPERVLELLGTSTS